MVQLTHTAIDVQRVIDSALAPSAGAIDVFIGTTRDNSAGRSVTALSYEAYEPMALKVMARLEEEACARWPLLKVLVVHRIGTVPLSESSVVIAVSSAHRAEAFAACRYLIDRLKEEVPIWKTEHFLDGTVESAVPAGMAGGRMEG